MTFQDLTASIGKTFGFDIETVDDTCAFAVGGDDGASSIELMLQSIPERDLILFSADLGEVPPEADARFFKALLGANHFFTKTAGATLSLDTRSNSIRLQKYEHPDELANDIEATMNSFTDTALNWAKAIADYRAAAASGEAGGTVDELCAGLGFIQV